MVAEVFEYVKISMNSDGYSLVEVLNKDRKEAVKIYSDTIEELNNIDGIVTPFADDLEVKASNENTKFIPTVTVKGRGENVTTRYVEELARMKKGGEANGE
jgi:hypothetical protein